jgi:hypothetical protein
VASVEHELPSDEAASFHCSNHKISALLDLLISRSLCEKSRSCEVAWIRDGSCCDASCNLAAQRRDGSPCG